MSQHSASATFTRMWSLALNADRPVGAGDVDTIQENLLHLIDASRQFRINHWPDASAITVGHIWSNTEQGLGTYYYQEPFLHTWFAADEPANLEVGAIVSATSSISGTARVRVVPHFTGTGTVRQLGDLGAPALVDETLAFSSSTTETLLHHTEFDPAAIAARGFRPDAYGIVEGGHGIQAKVHMMRLEVSWTPDALSPGNVVWLDSVLVREYP